MSLPRPLHPFPTRRSSDLRPCRRRNPALGGERERFAAHKASKTFVRFGSGSSSRNPSWRQWRVRPESGAASPPHRSEEHTSELQSLRHLVCRLLLEQKKNE